MGRRTRRCPRKTPLAGGRPAGPSQLEGEKQKYKLPFEPEDWPRPPSFSSRTDAKVSARATAGKGHRAAGPGRAGHTLGPSALCPGPWGLGPPMGLGPAQPRSGAGLGGRLGVLSLCRLKLQRELDHWQGVTDSLCPLLQLQSSPDQIFRRLTSQNLAKGNACRWSCPLPCNEPIRSWLRDSPGSSTGVSSASSAR